MRPFILALALFSSSAVAEIFLVGTITGLNPVATVRSGGKVHVLKVGDPVDGWIVKRIDANAIVLTSPKSERVLRTSEYLTEDKLLTGITVQGDDITLSPEVHRYVTEESIDTIIMDATADAVYVHGKIVGFRLWNFDPGSVYDLVGFKNEDVVVAVDGKALTSPSLAVEILKETKQKTAFTILVERQGVTKLLQVKVK